MKGGGGNAFIAMGRHEEALTFLQRLQVRGRACLTCTLT